MRVTGEARVGKTLTADSSNLSERYGVQVTSMTYRWLADGARIPGAIARTYKPDDDKQGKRISVMATYTDDRGNEETVTSGPTEPLAARGPHQAGHGPAADQRPGAGGAYADGGHVAHHRP